MFTFRSFLIAAVAGVAALGAGCGSGAEPSATEASAVGYNEADVMFAQNMIPHHEQAIAMADLALDPAAGAGADVVALAEQVKAAQGPEVELMTQWLAAWSQPMPDEMGHDDHEMAGMEGMAGMMSAEDMDALAGATGPAFDALWLEMMIEHHEGAIVMAEQVKADGSNPDVLGLADEVVAAQQEEIAEMTQLLSE